MTTQDLMLLIEKEGNSKEWVYTCKNGISFDCSILRMKSTGHLCGYVSLTPDSDFYRKDYDDISIDCHGGLTYASDHGPNWVIGFDCAHHGDLQPLLKNVFRKNCIYRDMDFVTKECESICEQLSTKSKSHYRRNKIDSIL